MYTYAISVALSYKYILYMEVACTNCLASNLDIYTSKTPVPDSSALSTYLSIDKKPYYNSNLFLNRNIDLTSIGL